MEVDNSLPSHWWRSRAADPRQHGALKFVSAVWGMGGGGMDRLRGNQDRLLVCTDGPKAYLWKSINALFFSSYLNLLMLCTPFAVLARQHGSDGVIFAFSLLAIAPFAERLSFVTEQLALHTNETRHSRGTRGCAPQLSGDRRPPGSGTAGSGQRSALCSSGQDPSEPRCEARGRGAASGPRTVALSLLSSQAGRCDPRQP